jgi:hypothetical protein
MFRYIVILLLFVPFVEANFIYAQEQIEYCFSFATEEEYQQAKSSDNSAPIVGQDMLVKKDSAFVLPLDNGKTLILKDSIFSIGKNMEHQEFHYLGFLSSWNAYILKESNSFRWSSLKLVDKATGNALRLYPTISPSERAIVSYDSITRDYHNAGIQICVKDKASYRIAMELRDRHCYPEEIVWESKSSFIIKSKGIYFDDRLNEKAKLSPYRYYRFDISNMLKP